MRSVYLKNKNRYYLITTSILLISAILIILNYSLDFYHKLVCVTSDGRRKYLEYFIGLIVFVISVFVWLYAKPTFDKHEKISKWINRIILIFTPVLMVVSTELSENMLRGMKPLYFFLNVIIAAVFYLILITLTPKPQNAFFVSLIISFALGIINHSNSKQFCG